MLTSGGSASRLKEAEPPLFHSKARALERGKRGKMAMLACQLIVYVTRNLPQLLDSET